MPAFEDFFPVELAARGLTPTLPTVAILGDSISNQNTSSDSGTYAYNAKGYMTWAIALLRGRLKFPMAWNFGVSGQTSAAILARVGSVVSANPGWCAVLAGINDLYASGGFSPAATWANLKAIYDTLLAAGIRVIAIPILPTSSQGSLTLTDFNNGRLGLQWINRRIRQYAAAQPSGRMVVPNCDSALHNLASNGYDMIAGYSSDGLHPLAAGAYWMGKEVADAVAPYLPAPAPYISGPQNLFDATWNPLGNMLPNGDMRGTAGTLGTGATGVVSSGYTLSRSLGSSVTAAGASEVFDARTGEVRQAITFGGPGTGIDTEQISLSRSITAGPVAGDTMRGSIEVEWSGFANIRNVQLRVQPGDKYVGLGSSGNVGDRWPAASGQRMLIQTPEFVVPSGVTSITFAVEIQIDGRSVPAGALKLGRAVLGRIA